MSVNGDMGVDSNVGLQVEVVVANLRGCCDVHELEVEADRDQAAGIRRHVTGNRASQVPNRLLTLTFNPSTNIKPSHFYNAYQPSCC